MTIARDASPDTGVYYDPYDVDITADPYPTYARLREEAPIYYNERYNFWALSRWADVDKALSDWQTFSNTRSDILELMQSKFDMPPGVLMFEDPPVHTMLRGVMSRVFTPRRMAAIEDEIRAYCVRCLDPLVGTDGFDIIAELASMMPMRVIGMLLGIPEGQQIGVRDANDANLRTKPGTPMKVANADAIADGRIYADYVDWRAKNPSDDLMTSLLNVEFEDENGVTRKLTRKEVLHYTQVVAGAGNETTGRLIGWLAKVLAEHPDQRREVVRRIGRCCCARSTRRCATNRPARTSRATPCATSSATAKRFPRTARCCCCSGPPTATRCATPTPTPSTSTATTSPISRSARVCTTAWARIWRGWKARSPSTKYSTAGPSGASTTTACSSRPPQPCAAGRGCA